jgi:hypothetical protein
MSVIYYIGLDVHKDTVAVAIAPSDSAEIGQYAWSAALSTPSTNPSGNSPKPDVELRFVYKTATLNSVIFTGRRASLARTRRVHLGYRLSGQSTRETQTQLARSPPNQRSCVPIPWTPPGNIRKKL